eukprot:CAMPEP_0119084258 /NCGR_PEP_ID=MMETSP1178-20130426/128923_1 /TAXON_ID=33656 /ORGANISM="unid sp, Strain CCMP2000" /LENGTH=347 /DNA_ID=CAMNT_0007067209 /DNA_START=35 /DNA_END=1078 /DNA_ORIENTATION=-
MACRRGLILTRCVSQGASKLLRSIHSDAGLENDLLRASSDVLKRPRLEELVIVRHGESEGNVAYEASVAGDHSMYSGAFLERHSALWRLTEKGEDQAKIAGEWLRSNIKCSSDKRQFDCHFTSEYVRAMETAGLLGLPGARWRPEVMLRERDWGEYDLCSQQQRREAFEDYEARRRRESLFWAPPGGESLAQVVQRVDAFLLFINRRFAGGRVIIICHGELMWAFRLRFERLSQLRYREMQAERCSRQKIHNGQIIVYSRRCPETAKLHSSFRFQRFVCPWDVSRSGGDGWRPIERSGGLSGAELLAQARSFPRIYNNQICSMHDPELKRRITRYRAAVSSAIVRAP